MGSIDPKHADKRTIERYIRLGVVDEKEYEKHLKALPDLADQALPVEEVLDEDDEIDDEQEG